MTRRSNYLVMLSTGLFCTGLFCIAQAEMPMTGVGPGAPGGAVAYTGPGNINSYTNMYSTRAYTSATRGNKLLNACNSTGGVDVGCADLFSSASTGDLVAATVSGITCPGNANCTIKTWYDLGSGGNDVTQSTVASRPTFQTSALGGSRTCLSFNGSQWLSSVAGSWAAAPNTNTFVSERTGNFSSFNSVLKGGANANFGHGGGANQVYLFWGSVANATATDSTAVSVQMLGDASGINSTIVVNGSSTTGLTANNLAASGNVNVGGDGSQLLTGIICEDGYAAGVDQSANFSTLTTNQRNWFGF